MITRSAACLSMLLFAACGPATVPDGPLNVVLISVDTLRPDRLSLYGHDRPTSPSLVQLAAEGVVFERASSHSPRTAPSHMTLLTGLLPAAHGVVNYDLDGNTALPPDIPTLATLLGDAGWSTAAVTGAGNVDAGMGFARGFQSYEQVDNGPDAVAAIFERAAARLDGFGTQPFFLFVHTYETHDPYAPPADARVGFVDPDYAGAIVSDWTQLQPPGASWLDAHTTFWSGVDPASRLDRNHLLDLYDASIRRVDDLLATLVEQLRRAGVWERTLLVFVSDHGEEFGEHGGFLHETVFEECLRVPLFLRLPATERLAPLRGRRSDALVGLADVLPTLLDLQGLDVPAHLQGRRLPLDGSQREEAEIVAHAPRFGLLSLRSGPWKLVIDVGLQRALLFDLANDPGETRDLSGSQPLVVARLLRTLAARQDQSARLAASFAPNPPATLDETAREHLRALGYLHGDR